MHPILTDGSHSQGSGLTTRWRRCFGDPASVQLIDSLNFKANIALARLVELRRLVDEQAKTNDILREQIDEIEKLIGA